MPNYSGHMTINFSLVSGATVFALSALNCEQVSVAVVATSFVFATLFLSPDLDIYYSSPTKNWGILRLLWLPYSLFFKHRGISHSLFFSTLTRIIYLSAVVTVAFLIFHFCKIYLIDTNLEEAVVAAGEEVVDDVEAVLFRSDLMIIPEEVRVDYSDYLPEGAYYFTGSDGNIYDHDGNLLGDYNYYDISFDDDVTEPVVAAPEEVAEVARLSAKKSISDFDS